MIPDTKSFFDIRCAICNFISIKQDEGHTKGFSISRRETVKENINRILLEQIDYILKHCDTEQKDVHKSIHEIRKSIKRIRAVLRLIREEIGYSSYYRENVFYRDMNRSISDLRSYNVLLLTLKMLQSDLSNTIPAETFKPMIESILEQRDKIQSRLFSADRIFHDISMNLLEAKKRIPMLPIDHNSFEAFNRGMHRIYRQGRNYLSVAEENPDVHHLHDMRKRTKYLWYHIEILKPIYPVQLEAYAEALEIISEDLGVYHDLDLMSEYMRENNTGLQERILESLQEVCEIKKSVLLPGILSQAGAAFSEEPGAFVDRMGVYWKIYHTQNS
ncbi:CHAD domain-containing protein [Bacteroidota bacterium]